MVNANNVDRQYYYNVIICLQIPKLYVWRQTDDNNSNLLGHEHYKLWYSSDSFDIGCGLLLYILCEI